MITSSGPVCDVCGRYILPFGDERVNTFTESHIPGVLLHCDNKCKVLLINANKDWTKLPPGPLRTAYENAIDFAKKLQEKE